MNNQFLGENYNLLIFNKKIETDGLMTNLIDREA